MKEVIFVKSIIVIYFDFMDKVINIVVYYVGLVIWILVVFEGIY